MPLVYVDVCGTRSKSDRQAIGDAIHQAIVAGLGVPAEDRFQVFTVHEPDDFMYSPTYMGAHRTDPIFIQIILYGLHADEEKEAMYAEMAAGVEKLGIARDELFVAITENGLRGKRDWYAGVDNALMPDPVPGHFSR